MDIRHAVDVAQGVPPEHLAEVLRHEQSPWFSERERAAIAFS